MNNLKPYAMSQIAERHIRVLGMLLAIYNYEARFRRLSLAAVTQYLCAAFVGMVASFAVYIYFRPSRFTQMSL